MSILSLEKKQLIYKGWSLYFFGQDSQPGGLDKDVSFPTPGVWPVLVNDIAVLLP